ncbi:MAG: 4Fe-4S binding protein [Campylobacterales bacterium]
MIASLFKAFTNLFKKPATIPYPAAPTPIAPDTRGLIAYDESKCIFCLRCEEVCPPGAIVFTWNLDGTKKYHYNPYLCIYCAECVRACPDTATALSQVPTLAPPTVDKSVNDAWFALEKEREESIAAYKAAKEAKKNANKEATPTPEP